MPPQVPTPGSTSVPLNTSAVVTFAAGAGGGPAVNLAFTALFTVAGTYTFTGPAGVAAGNTQCWAGGGSGGGSSGVGGSGGGGGEFASEPNNVLTPGTAYTVVVGTAGAGVAASTPGNNGGNSSFTGTGATTVTANGGGGGGSGGAPGTGGTGSTNSVHHNGGNGGTQPTGNGGSGGGSSAGPASAGNNGAGSSTNVGGAGGLAVSGGGPGSAGGNINTASNAPASGPGGGSGGGGVTAGSGAGFAGQVSIGWTMPNGANISASTSGGVYTVKAPTGATSVTWTITGAATFDGQSTSGSEVVTAGNSYTFSVGVGGSLTITFILTPGPSIAGNTAKIGPIHHSEVWYPESIAVSANSNVQEATCRIYIGSDTTMTNFVDSTTMGSTGFVTFPTANRRVHQGEYVWAVWSGGDIGAQGRLNVQGTKVINSGGRAPGR